MTTQEPTAQPPETSTEFRAVEGSQEQFNGATLLVEAYAALWLILMAWLVVLWRKQARLSERLDDLEAAIDRAESEP